MAQTNVARVGEAAVLRIERQTWLDRVAERLQQAIAAAVEAGGDAGRRTKDFLHGTWLGHPLHPVLTDIPLGAWTAALVLDALDGRDANGGGRYAPGADAAIAVGIAGASAAALAGLADWQHTSGGTRRTGLAHGMLNAAALGFFVTSLAARRRGARSSGRALAGLGYAIGITAAYLGGELVYRQRMGVDHSQAPGATRDWVDALAADALREGQPRRVEVDGVRVLLVRQGGRVYALDEVCSHMGGPLAEGRVEDGAIVCPWHGSRFDLEDGSVVEGPATAGQTRFEARERGSRIEVRLVPGD